jgi:hypothetical protein
LVNESVPIAVALSFSTSSRPGIRFSREIQKYVEITGETWKKMAHYNNLRNKLVHERGAVGLTDDQIDDYLGVVEDVKNV